MKILMNEKSIKLRDVVNFVIVVRLFKFNIKTIF